MNRDIIFVNKVIKDKCIPGDWRLELCQYSYQAVGIVSTVFDGKSGISRAEQEETLNNGLGIIGL